MASDPSETDDLLRRASEGDEAALAELFSRYRKRKPGCLKASESPRNVGV
jgi:hypothetical protein